MQEGRCSTARVEEFCECPTFVCVHRSHKALLLLRVTMAFILALMYLGTTAADTMSCMQKFDTVMAAIGTHSGGMLVELTLQKCE